MVTKIAHEIGADIRISVEGALNNQYLKIHLNDEVEKSALKDLMDRDFYGFNRKNIYFSNQPEFNGYRLNGEARLLSDPNSPKLVYGHGDNVIQLNADEEVYQIDEHGQKEYLKGETFLTLIGQRFVSSQRVNDLTKFLTDQVVDIDKFAMGMYLHDQGSDIVVDLVANPNKNKGGTATNAGLLETLAAKGSKVLTRFSDDLSSQGAPYNAFRLLYRADKLKRILQNHTLPYYLRFKDGYFYIEAVTGDLTQFPDVRTAYIQREGQEIQDLKSLAEVIPYGVPLLRKEDNELRKAGISTLDLAMNSEYKKPTLVGKLMSHVLQEAFGTPFVLNPTQSEEKYLQEFPGIHSWAEAALFAHEYITGDKSKAVILGGLINLSNVMPWLKDGKYRFLKPAKQRFMDNFSTPKTDKQALEGLKKGEYFVEILAGGMADRAKKSLQDLGLVKLSDSDYRIWNIKFWDIIRAAQGILVPKTEESRKLVESIQDISIPDYAKDYTIGQRELYAISQGIDEIPGATDEDKVVIRKNLKIEIHVNGDILKSVIEDFKKYNFFGFTPGNILIVNGGYGLAYKITDHGLEEEKDAKVSWNHLFAFMENKWKIDEVYTFDDKLELVEAHATPNKFLHDRHAKYGLVRRINDAILLHPQGAMDLQFFSSFLGAKEVMNANVLYQVMPNTARNKGGLAVTLPQMGEFSFPYEAMDSQNFNILQGLSGMVKTPYNRLYMMYELKSVDAETNTHEIPVSLKVRSTLVDGKNDLLVSPESPIGNLLLVPGIHGLAVERRDDLLFSKGIFCPSYFL